MFPLDAIVNRQEFGSDNVQIECSALIQQILLHHISDTGVWQREKDCIIQLLARIVDTMTEMEKRTYIFRYGNLFILFLCVQLLIVIVDIDLLMLSDVDTVEVISHILRSQSTDYMFMLAELDSISYQTHNC